MATWRSRWPSANATWRASSWRVRWAIRRVSGSGAWRSRKPSSDDERALAHDRQQERRRWRSRARRAGSAATPGRRRSTAPAVGPVMRGPAGEHLDVAGLVGHRDGEHLLDLAEVRVDLAEEPRRHDERRLLVLDQERHHLHDGDLDAAVVRRSVRSSRRRSPGPTARQAPGRTARSPGRSRPRRAGRSRNAGAGPPGSTAAPRAARPHDAGGSAMTPAAACGIGAAGSGRRRPSARPPPGPARRRRPRRPSGSASGARQRWPCWRHHVARSAAELGVGAPHADRTPVRRSRSASLTRM